MANSLNRENLLLFIIIALAFVLRVWGNDFGLPYVFHPDEGFEVNRALQLASGSYDFTRAGKGGYFYLLFVEYGIFFVIAWLTGMVAGAEDFAVLFVADPTWFYLIGRTTTAIIGSTSVILLFLLVKRISTVPVALIAALFLCVNPMHVEHSHYITVDVPLTFFCILTFLLLSQLKPDANWKSYAWIGASIAGAAMTKLPGILLLLPFFLTHIMNAYLSRSNLLVSCFDKRLILGGVVFILVFVIGNPAAVVSFDGYAKFIMSLISSAEASTIPVSVTEIASGELNDESVSAYSVSYFKYYMDVIIKTVTWPLAILIIIGSGLVVTQKRFHFINLLLFSLVFYSILGVSAADNLVYERYVLPFIPFLLALAALAVNWLVSKVTSCTAQPIIYSFLIVASLAFSMLPLKQSVAENKKFGLPDTRELAVEWFKANVDESKTVLIEGHTARTFSSTVPLKLSKEQLGQVIAGFRISGEAGKARYFELDRRNEKAVRHRLHFYGGDTVPNWDDGIVKSAVDFIVVTPGALKSNMYDSRELGRFFDALAADPDLTLAVQYHPVEDQIRGPVIMVYASVPKE